MPANQPVADFVALPTDAMWAEIAVGASHACALDKNHRLMCWGHSIHGQIGDGGHASNVPVPLAPRAQ